MFSLWMDIALQVLHELLLAFPADAKYEEGHELPDGNELQSKSWISTENTR